MLTEAQLADPNLVPVDIPRRFTRYQPLWWRLALHERQRAAGVPFEERACRW